MVHVCGPAGQALHLLNINNVTCKKYYGCQPHSTGIHSYLLV
jgi:hypothetical protein